MDKFVWKHVHVEAECSLGVHILAFRKNTRCPPYLDIAPTDDQRCISLAWFGASCPLAKTYRTLIRHQQGLITCPRWISTFDSSNGRLLDRQADPKQTIKTATHILKMLTKNRYFVDLPLKPTEMTNHWIGRLSSIKARKRGHLISYPL